MKKPNIYKNAEFLEMHKKSQQLIDKAFNQFVKEIEGKKEKHYFNF